MAFIYEMEFRTHSVIENLDGAGLAEGEPEISIITSEGFLRVGEEERVISYTEKTEGGRVVCELTLKEGEVRLSRRGAVVFDATFREGESYSGIYSVPPYSFDTEIKTKRIRDGITKAGGELSIIYNMNIGGQEKAVRLRVTAKRK